MTKLEIAKRASSFVVGIGTSIVVKGVIETNVVRPGNLPARLAVYAAAAVIGSMASKAAAKHSDEMIDEFVVQWNLLKSTETE